MAPFTPRGSIGQIRDNHCAALDLVGCLAGVHPLRGLGHHLRIQNAVATSRNPTRHSVHGRHGIGRCMVFS